MSNDAHVAITGYVATVPKWKLLPSGVLTISMRIGWTPRRMDRATGQWVDGNTSYATVICWRKLAEHLRMCLRKGDPVNVIGRLSVREFEQNGVQRTVIEIDASSIGHDFNRGIAIFTRVKQSTGQTADEAEAARAALAAAGGQPPVSQDPAAGDGAPALPAGDDDRVPAGYDGDDTEALPAGRESLEPDIPAGEELAEDDEDELAVIEDQVPVPF